MESLATFKENNLYLLKCWDSGKNLGYNGSEDQKSTGFLTFRTAFALCNFRSKFEIQYDFNKSPKKGIGKLNKNFHLYCPFRKFILFSVYSLKTPVC